MLDRDSKVPLHEQLADLLRERIQTGQRPAHRPLPSERAMCDQYRISRITMRKALSKLHFALLMTPFISRVNGIHQYVFPVRGVQDSRT